MAQPKFLYSTLMHPVAGIYKNFPIGERVSVQVRGEFFNIFNRANFITPGNTTSLGYSAGSHSVGRDLEMFWLLTTRASRNWH